MDNGTNCTDNGTNRMVSKMCPDIQKHSMKNARILFIVKSEFLGYYAHYNRARPTLLIKERRQHSYDTYDYDSTVFHNEGFTTPV